MADRNKLRAGILIVSDTATKDPSTDRTIPLLKELFRSVSSQWDIAETLIVPDNVLEIQRAVRLWTDGEVVMNLVVTSGGTGFALKDQTPEALSFLIHKHAPGLVHGMLSSSLAITPFAMMSRPVAGVRNKTIILSVPGSPKGAKENLEAVLKLLPHACIQAQGEDSRSLHAGGIEKLEKDAGVRLPETKGSSEQPSHCHHHGHHHHGHHGPRAHTNPKDRPTSNDPSAGPTRRARSSPYPMLSVPDALALVAEHTPPPVKTIRAVDPSILGHVLASDIQSNEPVPAFRASIVDGYAVRFPKGQPKFSTGTYPVALVSHAAKGQGRVLNEGEIARITTGAPLPSGADAVVMVEDTAVAAVTDDGKEEKDVEILTDEIKKGENVREVGSDVSQGSTILKSGEQISMVGGEFGLLVSVGAKEVEVYRKPIVGVMSTGDEIIDFDEARQLELGEVRDTNRPILLTSVKANGFEAVDLGIVSDKIHALEENLRLALRQCDVLITTGGVSMGELDLLKPTIERSLGGTIHFGRVNMKPGKPTTFATVTVKGDDGERVRKVIFSLPGNPASAVVAFNLFVLPSLHHASGIHPLGLPRVNVRLDEEVKMDPTRPEYCRGIVFAESDGLLRAVSTGGQRSSKIGSFKGANAFLCLPAGSGVLKKGDNVEALLLGRILNTSNP
ncbi:hypothetical protein P152DRAFT_460651 [Eremomyces bilateralis CBS 781.70]|uniref:MoaB/Mog domain-containing protein n=1 Tax=Eremomyces bilateralis CBS 781.70 TaxID=1392243 RepID=A0A6G1FXU9_9PEZI|nr:uncharacterized protein P152DRAFT_460651 [Eremomyces bilateralis CBS 781.70]KAF1810511.1 hypothetical protein P152DRAFT_460651 [Eremomyces bilateralis CBS 781.70]